ncbi:MAG: hypothetical protein Q8R39_02355 [bacterium]|nr:hypothetical protein [bacterium]MDZ4284664.1 hypothetical protein [Patescibacteria group bacterium]
MAIRLGKTLFRMNDVQNPTLSVFTLLDQDRRPLGDDIGVDDTPIEFFCRQYGKGDRF